MDNDYNIFDASQDRLEPDMLNEEYHAHSAIGRSGLWRLLREGPAAFDYYRRKGVKTTDPMRLGSGLGEAILEPDTFETRVTVYDGRRDNRIKEWQEFQAANRDTIILKREDWDRCLEIRDLVLNHPQLQVLLREGNPEQSIFWTDPETGIECKSRPDWLDIDRRRIVDLKSSSDWGDWAFYNKAKKYGVLMQGAMFLEAAAAVGVEIDEVWLMFVKTSGAPAVDLVRLTEAHLAKGREDFRAAIELYAKCTASGKWPLPKLNPRDLVIEETF